MKMHRNSYLQKLLCSHVLKLFLSTAMEPVNNAAVHRIAAMNFILSDYLREITVGFIYYENIVTVKLRCTRNSYFWVLLFDAR